MVPAAIGSQTGGSITRPAAYCGVCGMKPTFQTVPLDGVIPVAPSLDHPGPITRTVGDLRVMLQAMTETACVESELPAMSHLKLGRLRHFLRIVSTHKCGMHSMRRSSGLFPLGDNC